MTHRDVTREYHLKGVRNGFTLGIVIGTMLGAMTAWLVLR